MHRDVRLGVIREDVQGAPFRLGTRVRVVCPPDDDSLDERFIGREGIVRGLVYDDAAQYPSDPMVLVEADALGADVFFPEELRPDDSQAAGHRPYRVSAISRGAPR